MATDSTFTWTGLDKNGRKNKGEVVAASVALAKAQLRKQGIQAKNVKKKTKYTKKRKGTNTPISKESQ